MEPDDARDHLHRGWGAAEALKLALKCAIDRVAGAGVRWYLFGAQAAIFHGAARLTADVEATGSGLAILAPRPDAGLRPTRIR